MATNFSFNPIDEERKAIRPDLPGIRASEGMGSSASTAGKTDGGATSSTGASDGGATDSTGSVPSRLSGAESSPWKNSVASASMTGGAAGVGGVAAKGVKNMFFGSSTRKKTTIGGSIAGIAISGGIIAFTSLAGPAELVQLSHILQRNFNNSQSTTSSRANKLFRFATSTDAKETRVGVLGRQFLRPAVQNLEDIGIKFDVNGGAGLNGATIETDKLAEKFPELTDMSPDARSAWLDEKFPAAAGQFVHQGGGTFTVNTSDFALSSDNALAKSSLSLLGDGKIITGINGRVFSSYLNVSSLFHPLSQAAESKLKQATTAAKRQQAAQEDEQAIDAGVENDPAAVKAVTDAENNSNDAIKQKAMSALAITGGACYVRSVAGDISTINRYRIALPAAVEAFHFISIGEQIQNGQDVPADQINSVESSLTNNKGQNIWQGTALQALEGDSKPSGIGLSQDYKQAFSGNGIAQTVTKWANDVLGTVPFVSPSAICSPIGMFFQLGAGLFASISSVVADVGSFGALTPGIVGLWGAKEGASFAETAVAMHFLQGFVLDKTTSAKLAKDAFSGGLGGNLLGYGARYAADMGGAAEGLVPLSNSNSTTLTYQQEQQSQQQFHSENFFARMFDINDYRSLAGSLADSLRPSLTQNFASAASDFGSLGSSLLSNFSSIFIPKTQAATSNAYNWGFPQVGIPQSMLDAASLADPYANANDVAGILNSQCLNSDGSVNSGCDYIHKVYVCFGNNIEKDSTDPTVWDVVKDHPVDMSSDDYNSADCGNISSDPTWKKIVMFVVDTKTMQAMACYQGDDQSCQEIGEEATPGTATPTTPTNNTTCGVNGASNGSTTPQSFFTTSGNVVCDANGKQFVPYGISIVDDLVGPDWQNPKYQAATDAQIQAAGQSWHANTIRIQVAEANFMHGSTNPKQYDQATMQRLGQQVDEIESYGKIPVISDNTEQTDAPQKSPNDETLAFWQAVTAYFASKSPTKYSNVILDAYNEPQDKTQNAWQVWQKGGDGYQGMQAVVNAIRNSGNALSNNLIWVEGPYVATTLSQLDSYPITGSNLEFSYHHVNFTGPSATWQNDMGLNLKTKVPIVDGEWAQYASARPECYPKAPQYIANYFQVLQTNHIGLLFWALEPGVGTKTNNPAPVTDKVGDNWVGLSGKFPTTAADFTTPNTFESGNYSCTGGTNGQNLIDQGAGQDVLNYFQKNSGQ